MPMLLSRSQNFLNLFTLVLKNLFILGIYFYRAVMKPFMSGAPACRFQPSCSEYSKIAFEQHSPIYAFFLTSKRLLKCNPFGSYGYDPVPSPPKIRQTGRSQIYGDQKMETNS